MTHIDSLLLTLIFFLIFDKYNAVYLQEISIQENCLIVCCL